MAGGEEGLALQYTRTWIVAVVCSVIVIISLFVERLLHFLGKFLKKKNQKPLFDALLKVKEELMLLGFISLLLVVFQETLQKICVSGDVLKHMLPCKRNTETLTSTEHFVVGGRRRLLASGSSDYCTNKGKFPLLSIKAIHDLHIFIFILAITHVVFSVVTMVLGSLKIREWKKWEDSIQRNITGSSAPGVTHVHQFEFIRKRIRWFGVDDCPMLTWVHSFFKQFFGSLTKSDYETMRLGFIMTHCKGNPKFNFHKYMVRALEADFKKVVGISWYLWIFVVVFMLLNVHGWHAYFWLAFVPLFILLAVGTKLEHVITQLAQEVAEKHSAIQGDLVVNPSDDHFWFHRPRIILFLIHFILFQNAFEIAFFFWILTSYGFNSCIMGSIGYIIPRLVIVLFVQLICSYSTLPLYAIVSHMGSSFKMSIFNENVQEGLVGWAQKVKRRKGQKVSTENTVSNRGGSTINGSPSSVMLHNMVSHHDPSFMEEGRQLQEEEERA